MPTFNAYDNDPGHYILAAVDGNPITLQVTPTASELLQNLGYTDGSDLSWDVVLPLYNRDEIFTHKTGVSESEISNSDGDFDDLSPEQKEVFEEYLNGNAPKGDLSIFNEDVYSAADALLVDRQETSAVLRSLPNRSDFARAIVRSKDIPFDVVDIEAQSDSLVFDCRTSNETRLLLIDARWDHEKDVDFHVNIQPKGEDTQFDVLDGYITRWVCGGNTYVKSTGEFAKRHKTAYKTDRPKTGGMGYDPENRTELLQRLFLFVDYYDLRPDPRGGGHRKIATQSELENQYIWVTPRRTPTSTSKSDTFIIDNELVGFTLRGVEPYTEVLVHIQGIEEGNAKTEIVEMERGITPSGE